jgi:hypothetical protein
LIAHIEAAEPRDKADDQRRRGSDGTALMRPVQ